MTLITEEVEVGLCNNIQYYESLGYKIPRYYNKKHGWQIKKGDKIRVKTKDLSLGSKAKIDYSCDNCGKILKDIEWTNFQKTRKEDGKNYCLECSREIFGKDALRLTTLKKGLSFYQWCINNGKQDILERWDYELNEYGPEDIPYYSNKFKPYLKCPNNNHKSERKSLQNLVANLSEGICFSCKSLAQRFPESLNFWSDKNDKTPYDYSFGVDNIVYWKCENEIHEDYKRKICQSTILNFRCPNCSRERNESIFQEKVRLYLEELCDKYNWKLNHEHFCFILPRNPKTKDAKNSTLPYDNEIISNDFSLIIETNGKQHYKTVKWHKDLAKRNNTTPQEELEYQQWRDQYKKDYALSQGYYYLAIPYTADDKAETWKQMIDSILNDIMNN